MVEYPIKIGPFQRADNRQNSIKKILKEKKERFKFLGKKFGSQKKKKNKLFKILKS